MEALSRLEVNLAAIGHNLAALKRATAAVSGRAAAVCGVIKADAYGLGGVRVAKRLESAGVEMLSVFTPDEARRLLDAAVALPILVLMPIRTVDRSDALYRGMLQGRVHFAIHALSQLESLIAHAERCGLILPVHVEVDTGMARGGASPSESEQIVRLVDRSRRVRLAGIYTHFAAADNDDALTRSQARTFDEFLLGVESLVPEDCLVHAAAAAGVYRSHEHHRDMIRVGVSLYGYAREEIADADDCPLIAFADELIPAVRWTTNVVHAAWIDAGRAVGYAGTWTAPRRTRLALLPIGYADGFPRALSNVASVGFPDPSGGPTRYAPVVGRISMDQMTVDVTDLPNEAAEVGAEVELFSGDRDAPNYVPTLARRVGTITHELLSRVGPRVARRYPANDPAASSFPPADRPMQTRLG